MLEDGRERSDMMEEEEYKDFGSDEEIAQDEEVFEEEIGRARKGRDPLDILLERPWVSSPKNLREELYSIFVLSYVRLARKNRDIRELESTVAMIRPYSDEYIEGTIRLACVEYISEIIDIVKRKASGFHSELLIAIGDLIAQLEKNGIIRVGTYNNVRVCSVILSVINAHPNEWNKIEDVEETIRRLVEKIEGPREEGSG